MKNKITYLIIASLLIITMINSASAEMYYWTDIYTNQITQTASQHAYYQFDDTSNTGIGRNKDIEIIISYLIQDLPYNLTGYSGQVDWCNLSLAHTKNTYGTEFTAFQGYSVGQLLNTTTEYSSYYFINESSGEIPFKMRDKDSLVADMKCHYTDAQDIYVENILFGRFDTYFPAFECEECTQYTLEELSNEATRNEQITEEQISVYTSIQEIIKKNYQLWIIGSWIIKITFLVIAVGLIFAGIYWLYKFFKDIEQQI